MKWQMSSPQISCDSQMNWMRFIFLHTFSMTTKNCRKVIGRRWTTFCCHTFTAHVFALIYGDTTLRSLENEFEHNVRLRHRPNANSHSTKENSLGEWMISTAYDGGENGVIRLEIHEHLQLFSIFFAAWSHISDHLINCFRWLNSARDAPNIWVASNATNDSKWFIRWNMAACNANDAINYAKWIFYVFAGCIRISDLYSSFAGFSAVGTSDGIKSGKTENANIFKTLKFIQRFRHLYYRQIPHFADAETWEQRQSLITLIQYWRHTLLRANTICLRIRMRECDTMQIVFILKIQFNICSLRLSAQNKMEKSNLEIACKGNVHKFLIRFSASIFPFKRHFHFPQRERAHYHRFDLCDTFSQCIYFRTHSSLSPTPSPVRLSQQTWKNVFLVSSRPMCYFLIKIQLEFLKCAKLTHKLNHFVWTGI